MKKRIKKKVRAKENLRIEIYNHKQELQSVYEGENLITTVGLKVLANRLINVTYDPMSHIAIGTGTTAPTMADTTLETEVMRDSATITFIDTDTTEDTIQMVKIFTMASDLALTEAGVFNDASAGEMFARHTFSALNVLTSWQVKIIWRFDFD